MPKPETDLHFSLLDHGRYLDREIGRLSAAAELAGP